jgi:Ni,Fe-hydrogenase I small subunit
LGNNINIDKNPFDWKSRSPEMQNGNTVNQILADMKKAKSSIIALKDSSQKGCVQKPEIEAAEKNILSLEQKAKSLIKILGCTDPETRSLFKAMADMVIQWYDFVDDLD